MNYKHSYHAGNFADVFKHLVLTLLIKSLLQKEKGFCYLETHAGTGCYDLQEETAQRTKEYQTGIQNLWHENLNFSPEINEYLAIVKKLNSSNQLNFYPGSPLFAKNYLRSQDKMILAELHPQAILELKQCFMNDKQVAIHHMDGYQALKAFLPPKEKRGLVLIDPPYENKGEFAQLLIALKTALKRWSNGMYAIWYPIKKDDHTPKFLKNLREIAPSEMLIAELSIFPEDSPVGLNGSGMAILNPPWHLDEQLKATLPTLWQLLSPRALGRWKIASPPTL